MIFRSILITILAAVVAAPTYSMDVYRQDMISYENILRCVEEIGNQGTTSSQVYSSMRFIQNEIYEQLAPMLNQDGAIDRAIAADVVNDIFRRNGFSSEMRDVVTAMIRYNNNAPVSARIGREDVSLYNDILPNQDIYVVRRVPATEQRRYADLLYFMMNNNNNARHENPQAPAPLRSATTLQSKPQPQQSEKPFTHKPIDEETECSICCEKLQGASDIICILPCDDHFHRKCIEGWQKTGRSQANNCPNCRTEIKEVKSTPK